MTQEYLQFSDLSALDSSPDAVRTAFKNQFNKTPDGIALNTETYYNAVKPPITEQYSHYCYKVLGPYDFTTDTSEPPQQAVVGSNTAVNNGDTEAEISLTVQGAWTDTTAWSSSITTGMTFSQELTIEGVFKMGMSFSVSATVGQSGSSSVQKSSAATVSVKVPPHSQVTVEMVATMQSETMGFNAPINVSGMFGANFPDRVDGHYFWFLSASQVLPKTSGQITGSIKGTSAFNVHTTIGQATPV